MSRFFPGRRLKKYAATGKVKQNMKYPRTILIPSKGQEVNSLIQQLWIPENRRTIVCVDSYRDGVFQGRVSGVGHTDLPFYSLSQFLVMMDDMLEKNQAPQSYTAHRSFSTFLLPNAATGVAGSRRKGILATFELKVLFRQHSSWQGVLLWQEQKQEKSFRSVLELVLLLDSALRQQEGKEAI